MREQYMADGDGFLLVYAINSQNSFNEVKEFHGQILRVKDTETWPMVICGNKADLGDRQRKISKEDMTELAEQLNVPVFETSAKTRFNVEEAFYELVREIRKTRSPQKGKKAARGGAKKESSEQSGCMAAINDPCAKCIIL
mmetsp:Transcript_15121/g.38360  ORF Transcript_15121/g.38360 Transcript_15121/m.38360 type:complete len:141 (+) Transcript_15121:730-1152(+)